jgi:hypothetical protein
MELSCGRVFSQFRRRLCIGAQTRRTRFVDLTATFRDGMLILFAIGFCLGSISRKNSSSGAS